MITIHLRLLVCILIIKLPETSPHVPVIDMSCVCARTLCMHMWIQAYAKVCLRVMSMHMFFMCVCMSICMCRAVCVYVLVRLCERDKKRILIN